MKETAAVDHCRKTFISYLRYLNSLNILAIMPHYVIVKNGPLPQKLHRHLFLFLSKVNIQVNIYKYFNFIVQRGNFLISKEYGKWTYICIALF